MMYALLLINVIAGMIIFVSSACQLARKRWRLYQPELLAQALLAGSAVYLIGNSINHHLVVSETMMNVAFALYLSTANIRKWQINFTKGSKK